MKKITPHLWFDKEAEEAARHYTSIFSKSKITSITTIHEVPTPKLSADPNAEQCGWLKDKFGVSWQVWPSAMGEMMTKGTPEQVARVTRAFIAMKKFDLAALQRAYRGK